jgi:hypothetical protein
MQKEKIQLCLKIEGTNIKKVFILKFVPSHRQRLYPRRPQFQEKEIVNTFDSGEL